MTDASAPPTDADDDPFERFNRAMGLGVVQDPYPEFHEARKIAPVIEGDITEAIAAARGERSGVHLDPMGDNGDGSATYTPLTFNGTQTVFKDGVTFSSSVYHDLMGPVMGRAILEMDEPEHGTYRRLIQQAFTRKAMEEWEHELVLPVVDELIDAFVDRGSADLVSELLFPFPVNVIAGLLGLPREDLPMFHRMSVELIGITIDWDAGMAASERLREYFIGILEQRRAEPRHDVISVLATAELDGQRLTDEEIVSFLRLLLPAGAETTYRSSSNLMCGLLTNPDQLTQVVADRGLLTPAIEEGLRWEPPLLTVLRHVTRDTVVEGVKIPEGSTVIMNIGAANRDPSRWDDPDRFDIHRPALPHIAFASGAHMCLGMHLARMETRACLNRMFDRLPNLRLDPDKPDPYVTGLLFRAPPRLDVVWDA